MDTEGLDERIDVSLKMLVKTSFVVLIGLFISKILAYIYRIVIARYFGPEAYGLFSLSLMIVGWFVSFSTLGFADGVLRYVSFYRGKDEKNKIRYIFRFSLIVSSALSIFSGIVLYFMAETIAVGIFHDPNLVIFLKIFSLLVPISTILNIFVAVIKAYEKINWYSTIFYILQNVVKVAFLPVFILMGIKTNSIILSWFLGIFAMLIAFYFVCRRYISDIFESYSLKRSEKKAVRHSLLHYSWPIMFLSVISSILYWVDSFSIGYYKSAIEVGFYNAAIPIAMLLTFAPELFIQLFFPMVTREYAKKNFKMINELSQNVSKWIFMINIPLFALMIIFPGAIINILFGKEYLVAIVALRFLLIGSLFSSIFTISNNLLSMIGKSKLIMWDIAGAAILNLLLNTYLVPIYGIAGAGFATMTCFIVLNTLFFLQARHYVSITPFKKEMLKIALITLVLTTILYFVQEMITINIFTLGLLVGIYFVIYFLLIYFTNSLNEKDMMIIKAIKNKLVKTRAASGITR